MILVYLNDWEKIGISKFLKAHRNQCFRFNHPVQENFLIFFYFLGINFWYFGTQAKSFSHIRFDLEIRILKQTLSFTNLDCINFSKTNGWKMASTSNRQEIHNLLVDNESYHMTHMISFDSNDLSHIFIKPAGPWISEKAIWYLLWILTI